ncbi:MAG: aminotransferase class V-fold PLP-dependent enzyme, partial [Deltaproteobacteria bacterium]|nr:aminotransferase class V-fold PLP-dependent enzyme [Deltaproteobacteria bacterium]
AGIEFITKIGIDRVRLHELELSRVFLDGLTQIPGIEVYGPMDPESRVAVVSLNLADWSPSDLAQVLDRKYNIMTRPGLHCAPRTHRTIGAFPQGAVRFSFGWFNTREEISDVLLALDELARVPR